MKKIVTYSKNRFATLLGVVLISSCSTGDQAVVAQPKAEEKIVADCLAAYQYEFEKPTELHDSSKWKLIWEDDFNYPDSQLETNWTSQNSSSSHILCSRWRENAVVKDGVLELQARKEQRGNLDWTCGNIWTKKTFGYGYYEARYKYAGASGTNNSFWLFNSIKGTGNNSSGVTCELDVNEGHFPNEVNTNRHHWEGGKSIENNQQPYAEGLSPAYAHSFKTAVKTKRIRFSSKNASHFHIREFRIYEPNLKCYPMNILSTSADASVSGLVNIAKGSDTSITASGVYNSDSKAAAVADGTTTTSWVSQKSGEKWLEFNWPTEKSIGHIQFINGWQSGTTWNALISDYKIEAYVNGKWVEIASYDVKTNYNHSQDYHVYGMDWSATAIKFYYDNKLIRTIPNTLCNEDLNIYLSLAILEHAGEVTDAINGTSMKIDWVRYYQKK
ncbi:family 16 glycosylhydrolase [Flavobacterium sp. NG2]|uniref:glycoside hydrolase family 16 protein n=1 Tax=Flavobacterium sp. NG2 TaxID=3097547 RepID=UPI002A7F8350|nr:family 16 glycosylhydrolase [Flavobacterium sp. NG2]WPR71126.1 family 16 glycosylhydrolase [Flavobacterium sp. NG2]